MKRTYGFTIIEILISIVILTVGILGILAIFPRAIESATRSIEDTYSGIIAQSVMDAIKTGIQEMKVVKAGAGTDTIRYFILVHDGVGFRSNNAPVGGKALKAEILNLDYTPPDFSPNFNTYEGRILLPPPSLATSNNQPPIFFYPDAEANSSPNSPNFVLKENDFSTSLANGASKVTNDSFILDKTKTIPYVFQFSRVSDLKYQLSQIPNDVTRKYERLLLQKDPYLTYGFGLAISPAKLGTGNYQGGDLYFVRILIFRNWVRAKGHPANRWIDGGDIGTLISF